MTITQVPIKIMEAARTVTLKHPNSVDCVLFRKQVLRTADETLGGLPTLGGLGVLKSEDEPDYEYVRIGTGKILITGRYEGGAALTDRGDAVVPEEAQQEAQIVCVDEVVDGVQQPGPEPQKGDLVGMMPGGGVLIGFEIVGQVSGVSIYPYVSKWVISPRDELHDLEPWSGT
jgi:hypothetical protein